MDILTYQQLPQGGFAGLKEKRFVMDSRVFGQRKAANTSEGLENFVYLADANFLPKGETGMHPHKEIDVISIMVEGNVSHAGSLKHGQSLSEGNVQVQRAGGEGFAHNEINPDSKANQMIQLWVLPDESGEKADYKVYQPKKGQLTHVYGGDKKPNNSPTSTMYSETSISMVNATEGQSFQHQGKVMAYISRGNVTANGKKISARTLLRDKKSLDIRVENDAQIIFIYPSK